METQWSSIPPHDLGLIVIDDKQSTGFAPNDPTDGRRPYEWESRYPAAAIRNIRIEVAYVVCLLFLAPSLMFVIWREEPKSLMSFTNSQYETFSRCCYSWLGGTLGGVLFDVKWLYHTVARGNWHLDRRLWRMLTPHISGGLSFAFVLLSSSGLLRIFNTEELSRPSVVLSVSFLVGYFSDAATGKLAEVATTVFGTTSAQTTSKKQPTIEE